jgi:catechol-2,3-dioxygenase
MRVEDIDHVHVEVRDRDAAADWYWRVLGLSRHQGLAQWADDPMGPLILATRNGKPVLSLFSRESKPVSRDTTIAFRVTGQQFRDFLGELAGHDLTHSSGRQLTAADVVDHDLSWSLYFLDPDGNRLEVTTYDYEIVRSVVST